MKKIQDRNKSLKTNASRRLASYVSAGVCVSGTAANSALVVDINYAPTGTEYGVLSTSGPDSGYVLHPGWFLKPGDACGGCGPLWSQGEDSVLGDEFSGRAGRQQFSYYGNFTEATAGINFVNISLNADDNIFEAVLKVNLGTQPDSVEFLALAIDDTGNYLPISTASAAFDSAAVPEPSGMLLGLLALGSATCNRRRARPVRG
jgi:hypothetical protein